MQIILLRLYLKSTHKVKFYPGRRNFTQASVLVIFVTNIICFHFICVILCTQCIFCTVCNFMLLAFYAVSSKKLVLSWFTCFCVENCARGEKLQLSVIMQKIKITWNCAEEDLFLVASLSDVITRKVMLLVKGLF